MGPDATMMLTAEQLNAMLIGARGKALPTQRPVLEVVTDLRRERVLRPVQDEQGEVILEDIPADDLMTLGNILLNLVMRMKPEPKPQEVRRQGKVFDELGEALESNTDYVIGSAELAILRKATEQNTPGYAPWVLARVWVAIGTGEPEPQQPSQTPI